MTSPADAQDCTDCVMKNHCREHPILVIAARDSDVPLYSSIKCTLGRVFEFVSAAEAYAFPKCPKRFAACIAPWQVLEPDRARFAAWLDTTPCLYLADQGISTAAGDETMLQAITRPLMRWLVMNRLAQIALYPD